MNNEHLCADNYIIREYIGVIAIANNQYYSYVINIFKIHKTIKYNQQANKE